MQDIDKIRRVTAEVAAIIGAAVIDQPENTWQARCITPEGLTLIFSTWHKKTGEIWAYVSRDGTQRESAKCGEIGCNLSKDPAAIAKDIQRRLLPDALTKATAARAKWAEQDATATGLGSLARRFSALPYCDAAVEKAGSTDQHVTIRYHKSQHASLAAKVFPRGSVYIDRLHLYSDESGSEIERLANILAALGA